MIMGFIHTKINSFLSESKKSLYAPNGELSNLPLDLYNLVRTPEFKSWFGDWENDIPNASKYTDDNGEPLVLYHGTKNSFSEFDVDKQLDGWLGRGFYFTDDKKSTKDYGKISMRLFLNVRNPFIVNGNSPSDVISEIKEIYNTTYDLDIYETLKVNNHDGVFFNHWEKGRIFTCFYPDQIKKI